MTSITRNFIFVHGTGCRQPAYDNTFNTIQQQLKAKNNSTKLHRCYWGEKNGSQLNEGGISIPEFDTNRGIGDELTDEEYQLGLWNILYQDPLFELSILSLQSQAPQNPPPGSISIGDTLIADLNKFTPPAELVQQLTDNGITLEIFNQAKKDILREGRNAITKADDEGEYKQVIAKAIMAQSIILTSQQNGIQSLGLIVDPQQLADSIVGELGGSQKSIGKAASAIKNNFGKLLKSAGGFAVNYSVLPVSTFFIRKKRGLYSEEHASKIGDIMMYQARGQGIRRYIRDTINEVKQNNAQQPVIVIAHSLGGIACVDLFLESDPPQIDLLVTIGSQSSILYEWNALVNQPYQPKNNPENLPVPILPNTFPEWLNIYDKSDFLSYQCEGIFRYKENNSKQVIDKEVNNQKLFPASHDGYWKNQQVWDEIFTRIFQLERK